MFLQKVHDEQHCDNLQSLSQAQEDLSLLHLQHQTPDRMLLPEKLCIDCHLYALASLAGREPRPG